MRHNGDILSMILALQKSILSMSFLLIREFIIMTGGGCRHSVPAFNLYISFITPREEIISIAMAKFEEF